MRLIDRDAIHWRPDENWELYATAADIRAIMTDRAAFELGRADYAESHPWRTLWAWLKKKMGCKA